MTDTRPTTRDSARTAGLGCRAVPRPPINAGCALALSPVGRRACVGGLLLGVLGVLLLMRRRWSGAWCEQLATLTDARLDAGAIYLSIDGRLVIDKPVLRPGHRRARGRGRQRGTDRRRPGLAAARRRGTSPRRRCLSRRCRVSQSLDDQSINLAGLAPKPSRGSRGIGAGGRGRAFARRRSTLSTARSSSRVLAGRTIFRTIPHDPWRGRCAGGRGRRIHNLHTQEIGRCAAGCARSSRDGARHGRLDLLKSRTRCAC